MIIVMFWVRVTVLAFSASLAARRVGVTKGNRVCRCAAIMSRFHRPVGFSLTVARVIDGEMS